MTVQEVLEKSGFTKDQIAALTKEQLKPFETILTESASSKAKAEADLKAAQDAVARAEEERKAAAAALDKVQLEGRSNVDFYETKIVPGLTGWQNEKNDLASKLANAEALAAFYKTQNEKAREGGFVAADAPVFTPPAPPAGQVTPPAPVRDASGRYVAGPTGSPVFEGGFDPQAFRREAADALVEIENLRWKYGQLYGGAPLPIAPSELIKQAEAQKLPVTQYAAKIFNFQQKEQEAVAAAAKAHDDQVAATAVAAQKAEHEAEVKKIRDEYAAKERARIEGGGNNPDLRTPPGASKFAEVRKAEQEGTRKSPLMMTDAERRAATRKQIHSEIAEREAQPV